MRFNSSRRNPVDLNVAPLCIHRCYFNTGERPPRRTLGIADFNPHNDKILPMTQSSFARSYVWLAIILAFFLSVEYWIVQSIYFNKQRELISIGVAIDLTLGIPVL